MSDKSRPKEVGSGIGDFSRSEGRRALWSAPRLTRFSVRSKTTSTTIFLAPNAVTDGIPPSVILDEYMAPS